MSVSAKSDDVVHFENVKSIPRDRGFQPSGATAGSFQRETWIASTMIIASDADRAMTVREWDPVDQLNGHTLIDICTHPCNLEAPGDRVPVGPRSLTVTALSSGEGCLVHWNVNTATFVASATGRVREATTPMSFYSGGGATKKSACRVATRRADGGCGRSLRWSSSKMAKHRLPPPALISPRKPHLQTLPYLRSSVLGFSWLKFQPSPASGCDGVLKVRLVHHG